MDEDEFKPFHQLYKIVTFAMSAGIIYPNRQTLKWRRNAIVFVFATVGPISMMVLYDAYKSYLQKDLINITRHFIQLIPFFLALAKILLMYKYNDEAKQIIDEINHDHASYNHLPENYKNIVREATKYNLFTEKYWAVMIMLCVMVFPLMAISLNMYNCIFKPEPVRTMIHDVNIPFKAPEVRLESPYYEFIFIYMLYCCAIYLVNFVGYDGFFGIAINHACLKMQMYCMALEDAFKAKDEKEVFERMVEVIQAQCRVFKFVDKIQETFNIWLGMIFVGTVCHLCNCMYQLIEGQVDLRYVFFLTACVVHIYLPCQYAHRLKSMSLETATQVYSSGWEHLQNQGVRKMVLFMIARCQRPLNLTAFNLLTFDMELFVSILHTSYSMFTLLKS